MIFLHFSRIYQSSQDGKEKGFVTFAERALETNWGLQSGPWPDLGRKTEEGGRIPVRPVADGEG